MRSSLDHDEDRIRRQLQGMGRWDKNANLRDVLDRRDLDFDPGLTLEVLLSRLRDDRGPEPLIPLPYPKDDGTTRETCLLDPYDDLRLALLASSAAPFINSALPGPSIVLSTRFLPIGADVFYAEDWREAAKRKRLRQERDDTTGVGGFDVERHYPTISLGSLATVLNSAGVPTGLVDAILAMLEGFAAWPSSPRGLPAGPMASALLGTAALLPVDRLLMRLGVRYERWVDDFIVLAPDRVTFDAITGSVETQLGTSQRLNQAKTWYEVPIDRDESQIEFDIGSAGGSGDNASLEALLRAVEESDAKRCRFVLGGLRAWNRPEATSFVAASDDVWHLAPKHSGEYLVHLRRQLNEDDVEAIGERCLTPPTDRTAAGIAHCGRVLAARRVSAALGPALHDAAARASTTRYRAISPSLYRAASVSKEHPRVRHERSLDTASTLKELNSQRGLLDGLAVDTPTRAISSALVALARANPDLRPTIAWVQHRQRS